MSLFDISVAEKIAVLRSLQAREIAAGIFTREALVLDQLILDLHRESEKDDQG